MIDYVLYTIQQIWRYRHQCRSLSAYGKAVGTRRLFVSDNPESVSASHFSSNGFVTLWDDTVTGRSSVSYRMFIWHLNTTGASMEYGITIGNGSSGSTADTYAVQNLKMAVSVVTNFQAQGLCAAKALLEGRSIRQLRQTVRSAK